MKQKLKEYFTATGIMVRLIVLFLAGVGANDLSKNLHYGIIDKAVADELRIEMPEQIDSKDVEVPPAYPDTKLDKVKSPTHKLLGKE